MSKKDSPHDLTELEPPLVEVSIHYLLSLACRSSPSSTFERVAIITKPFGDYLLKLPHNEVLYHLEGPSELELYTLYPIDEWKSSLRRTNYQKEASEKSRQIRFALEQEALERKAKIQRKRDILQETVADVQREIPGVLERLCATKHNYSWNQKMEYLTYFVFQALRGESEKARVKFKISEELVKEFSALPVDPEFKNVYYQGSSSKEKDL